MENKIAPCNIPVEEPEQEEEQEEEQVRLRGNFFYKTVYAEVHPSQLLSFSLNQ